MLWHLLWITVFVVIYNLYRYYHEDDSYDYSPVETDTSDIIQGCQGRVTSKNVFQLEKLLFIKIFVSL